MTYLAYRVSTHHHYGESESKTHEHLIDTDTELFVLLKRVNEHFALPSTIRFERGTKHEIPAFSMESKSTYMPGGGGTDYTARIEIRQAPTLVKTHRTREALWYGRKDTQGAFKVDQQFGEWMPVTTMEASSYGERENYQVELLGLEKLACSESVGYLGDCRKADTSLPASHETNSVAFSADWDARTRAVQAPKTGRVLPHPGSTEATALLDTLLVEYNYPANSKNAARAGWEAANRWLLNGASGVVLSELDASIAIETTAREIYNGWKTMPGWVPWIEGGNSDRQDDARHIATIGVKETSNG